MNARALAHTSTLHNWHSSGWRNKTFLMRPLRQTASIQLLSTPNVFSSGRVYVIKHLQHLTSIWLPFWRPLASRGEEAEGLNRQSSHPFSFLLLTFHLWFYSSCFVLKLVFVKISLFPVAMIEQCPHYVSVPLFHLSACPRSFFDPHRTSCEWEEGGVVYKNL